VSKHCKKRLQAPLSTNKNYSLNFYSFPIHKLIPKGREDLYTDANNLLPLATSVISHFVQIFEKKFLAELHHNSPRIDKNFPKGSLLEQMKKTNKEPITQVHLKQLLILRRKRWSRLNTTFCYTI